MRLGPHQIALLSVGAGDLFAEPGSIKEERGPNGGLKRAVVWNGETRISVPADTLRRMVRRGLYAAGKITEAGKLAYGAWRARSADR